MVDELLQKIDGINKRLEYFTNSNSNDDKTHTCSIVSELLEQNIPNKKSKHAKSTVFDFNPNNDATLSKKISVMSTVLDSSTNNDAESSKKKSVLNIDDDSDNSTDTDGSDSNSGSVSHTK